MDLHRILAFVTGSVDQEILLKNEYLAAENRILRAQIIRGIVTYYCLFFIKIGSREVHLAGVTPHPTETWMIQVARNVTMAGWGFLVDIRYLIHDRDSNFTRAFSPLIEESGIKAVRLPIRNPNLNAFAERWIRSVKEE